MSGYSNLEFPAGFVREVNGVAPFGSELLASVKDGVTRADSLREVLSSNARGLLWMSYIKSVDITGGRGAVLSALDEIDVAIASIRSDLSGNGGGAA